MAIGDYGYQDDSSSTPRESFRPGGFWLRVWATAFDSAVLAIPRCLLDAVGAVFVTSSLEKLLAQQPKNPGEFLTAVGPFLLYVVAMIGSSLVLSILYYPLLESSRLQGTPGKRFFRLAVSDSFGERISIPRALGRHFARWIALVPASIALAGMIIPALFGQKPGVVVGIAVVLGFVSSAILALIHYPMAAFTADKQALHDKIAKTYVIRFVELSMGSYALRALLSIVLMLLIPTLGGFAVTQLTAPALGKSQQNIFSQLNALIDKMKLGKGGSGEAPKPGGWREIKPLWRDPSSTSSEEQSPRTNVALVTIKPNGNHSVSFSSAKSIVVGFEPIAPAESIQNQCVNNCLTITSGDQTATGIAAKIIAKSRKGEISVTLHNNESFPIEVVLYREKAAH